MLRSLRVSAPKILGRPTWAPLGAGTPTCPTKRQTALPTAHTPMDSKAAGLLLALSLTSLASCTSIETERNDWSAYGGPGAEHFRQQEVKIDHLADPAEPTNRALWAVNREATNYVVGPLATGWQTLVPSFARTGLLNFGRNLLYPVRLVNNLAQGKPGGAWEETSDFFVNTTVGGAGFWDPANNAGTSTPEDFGQSFEKAGWEDSSMVVLPFFGPTTARDTVGLVLDSLLDPATYFPPRIPGPALQREQRHPERVRAVRGDHL